MGQGNLARRLGQDVRAIRREKLKVIYSPPPSPPAVPPRTPASNYEQGTVVQDAKGFEWEAYFDTQDRQMEWKAFGIHR